MVKRVVAMAACVLAACMVCAMCGCTESYVPQMKSPTIEADALLEPGVLKVGVNASSYPFAGVSNSTMKGYDVDVAAAIATEMGLKVDFVDIGMSGAEALGDGTVDMVMGIDTSTVPAGTCWLSDGYAPSCICLFAAGDTGAPAAAGEVPSVGAQTSSLSALLVSQTFGNSALKVSIDLNSVVMGLADGETGYAAVDAFVGTYVSNRLGADTHIVGLLEEPSVYAIGIDSDNAKLQKAVSDALGGLKDTGVIDVIMTRWLGAPLDLSGIEMISQVKAASDAAAAEQARLAEEEAARAAAEAEAAAAAAAQPVEEYYEAPVEEYYEVPVEEYYEPEPVEGEGAGDVVEGEPGEAPEGDDGGEAGE